MAIGCFVKTVREEEEGDWHFKLRRTSDVQKSATVTIEILSNASGSRLKGSSPSNIVKFGCVSAL